MILQQLTRVKDYVGSLGPVWFLSITETIVCVDDLERRGEGLSAREVLGLVSALKEQKQCKIVLIWNDDAADKDKAEFQKYHEKVVDASIRFSPTAQECVEIALAGDSEVIAQLKENCLMFGISNIRLIKRIERASNEIADLLKEFDKQVLKQAVQTITLLAWSIYAPENAPSLEFLKKRRSMEAFADKKNGKVSEKEGAWNALLDASHFSRMDEFDFVLLDGVRDGFFDPIRVRKEGAKLQAQIVASKKENSFRAAWAKYHDSFDNNQEDVLDALKTSLSQGVEHVTPGNLNGTVMLFKALGRTDEAKVLIEEYVSKRGDCRELFDLRNFVFGEDVTDPDVIKAFNDKCATFTTKRSVAEILVQIARVNGWNPEDLTDLSALPVEGYVEMFKRFRGSDLRKVINASLQFGNFANATPEMTEISRRAREALCRIGLESPINARRVKAYGVDVDASD